MQHLNKYADNIEIEGEHRLIGNEQTFHKFLQISEKKSFSFFNHTIVKRIVYYHKRNEQSAVVMICSPKTG